ncbi:MAG TPA: M15 family metallopeptidase [Chthoniobacteraceae bacterium]|nr:M15 family metallopeptidase [Chthoniobacteraceae bacterium]
MQLIRAFSIFLLLGQFAAATRPDELIEITQVNPRIRIDVRYATADNFVGKPVYPSAKCFLRREVAERLSKVQVELETLGLGLKVWDGYRPLSVQKEFWKLVPDERYVASPVKGSRHNRGAAVDLTLVDREGKELEMPTKYDDFTEEAGAYAPCSERALENRKVLQRVMTANGFEIFPTEWWHFDAKGWEKYEILDLSFDQLSRPASLPAEVAELLAKVKPAASYAVADHLNPAFIQGDYDGDGKLDAGVLVKQKTTGAIGIAVVFPGMRRVVVLGGGSEFGNGGKDFAWMDEWRTVPRAENGSRPRKGDAIHVGKSESANALIYWDGKAFRWEQQGD